MWTRRLVTLSLAFLALAWPAAAQDDETEWYAGAGLGGMQTRFLPNYTFAIDSEPEQFENLASGWHVNLVTGRRFPLNDRFSLAVEGTASLNRIAWTLSIPEEPAEFRYSLPYTILASAIGVVRAGPGVSVFGEIGAGAGRVKEIKTSPVRSSYNVDKMRGVLSAGGGVTFPLTPRANLFGGYRYTRYAAFEYDTFNPAGTLIEHVEDAPRTHAVTAGVTMGF